MRNEKYGELSMSNKTRRSFLTVLLGSLTTFMATAIGIPVVRLIFYPLTVKSKESDWAEVGTLVEVADAKTPLRRTLQLELRDAWQETASEPVVFLIGTGRDIKALSAVCPHLGCSVAWSDQEEQFICPCHGGRFTPDGSHRSGPPPRCLDSLETKVVSGKVMVRYQQFRPNVPNREVMG
jgi:Rieske Fe-S protein